MNSRTWRQGLFTLPGIGVSLLPKFACPLCWPAYAGLITSIGLGFLLSSAYLLPLTAGFLVIAVTTLGFRARLRRGYGAFLLGLTASVVVLIAKFILESNRAMYAGIGLLIVASLWNTWPRHVAKAPHCCSGQERSNSNNNR